MSFEKPKNSEKMFLLDKTKSFVTISLHYNNDVVFWVSKKTEICVDLSQNVFKGSLQVALN